MRDRLSSSPISEFLTLSENLEVYECENFLLDGVVEKHGLAYWAAHTLHFHLELDGKKPYTAEEHFPAVRDLIASSLDAAGFVRQGREVKACSDELAMNAFIIGQYTEECSLYYEVNALLRKGHHGEDVSAHPLVPWIAHLNAIIRNEPEHLGVAFRGAAFVTETIEKYVPGQQFVWASFTSVSTRIDACLDGNVIFRIQPKSGISMHGKRASRLITHYSQFPEEDEAILPLGCAFRVIRNEKVGPRHEIDLDLYDHW